SIRTGTTLGIPQARPQPSRPPTVVYLAPPSDSGAGPRAPDATAGDAWGVADVVAERPWGGGWLRRGALCVGQGLVLALLGLRVCLALFILSVVFIPLNVVGVGAFLLPPIVLATRKVADLHRRLSRDWFGHPIPSPYKPRPRFTLGLGGAFSR